MAGALWVCHRTGRDYFAARHHLCTDVCLGYSWSAGSRCDTPPRSRQGPSTARNGTAAGLQRWPTLEAFTRRCHTAICILQCPYALPALSLSIHGFSAQGRVTLIFQQQVGMHPDTLPLRCCFAGENALLPRTKSGRQRQPYLKSAEAFSLCGCRLWLQHATL